MFKTKLQEVCQKKKWCLPTYSSTRDGGPDHSPTFTASILINGVTFHSQDSCKSSKEAQNQAAKMAYNHFLSSDPSGSPSTILNNSASDKMLLLNKTEETSTAPYMYKIQLQNYAQRKSLSLPVYSSVCEGLPHVPRFKAVVTVAGQTFESAGFFYTLKEAEYAAAKVAFSSLSKDGIQEDGCGFYKNLLQDLACKEGLAKPFYTTTESGASHVPIFISTVHVEGDDFHGVEAKTKKQAEINAARVAYLFLKERKLRRTPVSLSQSDNSQVVIECTSSSSDTTITANLLQKLNVKDGDQGDDSDEDQTNGSDQDQGEDSDETVANRENSDPSTLSQLKPGQLSRNTAPLCNARVIDRNYSSLDTTMAANLLQKLSVKDEDHGADSDEIVANRERVPADPPMSSPLKPGSFVPANNRSSSPNTNHKSIGAPVPLVPSTDGSTSPKTVLKCCDHGDTKQNSDLPAAPFTLLCNRVRVYSRRPEMKFPKGVTLLPISDDKWVAVQLEFPNEEGDHN